MRRIPSFTLLRTFEAAARLESFALASKELHLTPSAVSHQVKQLEQYFDCALFVRRNRRVELTAAGRRLSLSLARVMDALEASCSEVALAPSEQVLTVHCAPSFAVNCLGPRLAQFMRAQSGITIRLTTGAEPLDLTEAREVDIAISYGYVTQRAGIDVIPLGVERIAPLCAPGLLQDQSPEVLIGSATLIDSQLSQVNWRDWFVLNKMTLPSRPRPSFDRAALAIGAAVNGLGIVLESARLAEREMAKGELVELAPERFQAFLRETHFFSQRAQDRSSEKIRLFRNWLLQSLDLEG